MQYQPKKFENLLGIKGFSDQLLNNHFTLYQGYVINTNKLISTLETIEKEDKFGTPEYAELNRRLGWEFNGMRLHELYFANIAKDGAGLDKNSALYEKIKENFFGAYENFEKDFKSMGAMRGVGWVILCYEPGSQRLFNVWINEHDQGHLAQAAPLLVMDVFEHAYMTDYGIKKADYINEFFRLINWTTAEERFKKAISN